MKSKRFQYEYRQKASALHKRVGDVLRQSHIFGRYRIYQEYPVDRVNILYPDPRHKFDWVILDIFLVIEAHGEQHYKPVCFGGISQEEAEVRLISQKHRDNIKMDAAVEAGFTYVTIPYSDYDMIDDTYIWVKYLSNYNDKCIKKKEPKRYTEYEKRQLEMARQYRKQQYQKQKELARRIRNGKEGYKKDYTSS